MSNNQRFTHILHKYQIFFYWSSIDRFAVRLAGSPCCFHDVRSCRVSIAWCSSRIAGNNCCGRPLGQRCRSEDGLAMLGYGWLWWGVLQRTLFGCRFRRFSEYRLDHPKMRRFLCQELWTLASLGAGSRVIWDVKGGFEKKRQDLTQRGDETWDISVRLYRNVSHGLHRMPLPAYFLSPRNGQDFLISLENGQNGSRILWDLITIPLGFFSSALPTYLGAKLAWIMVHESGRYFLGVSINGGFPTAARFMMETLLNMDDLGSLPFRKPIYIYIMCVYIYIYIHLQYHGQ